VLNVPWGDFRKQCAIVLLLDTGDDDPTHTDGFTDNLEENLVYLTRMANSQRVNGTLLQILNLDAASALALLQSPFSKPFGDIWNHLCRGRKKSSHSHFELSNVCTASPMEKVSGVEKTGFGI